MQAEEPAEQESERRPIAGPQGSTLDRMLNKANRFDFFQAVLLLERLLDNEERPGRGTGPAHDRIRIRPHAGLAFPASDVRSIELAGDPPQQAVVTVTFGGLYGVDSPLPVYFYDAIGTEQEGSQPLRDFLDIFNSRLYALFFRAWKKRRPALEFETPGTDKVSHRLLCLAGFGTRNALGDARVPAMRLAAHAGSLSCRVRNSQGLKVLLHSFFKDVDVQIRENIPRWVRVTQRPTVGKGGGIRPILGSSATVGKSIRDVSGKFRIVLGSLGLAQYLSFLPGAGNARVLGDLVKAYTADSLEYDVELQLRKEEIPRSRLGDRSTKIGLISMVGKTVRPYARRIVSYAR